VMHPGASDPERMYPARIFAQSGRILVRDYGYQVLVTGTAAETGLVNEVCVGIGAGAAAAAGIFSLRQYAAMISLSPLLISNNTGPVHIAAGTGTPAVVAYARTNLQHTPWKVRHKILYFDVPCKACMRQVCPGYHDSKGQGIAPQDIAFAALELLGSSRLPSGNFGLPLSL
jgi:ADP-heptose:LPS heptosyltransferase